MAKKKEAVADEPCPQCGAAFVVDAAQDPAAVIDRKRRNAANPAAAERFAQMTIEKAAEHGIIHKCVGCGYRARFKAADPKVA